MFRAAQKKTFWKWVSIAFGAPAGVSFLADINEKLDLGPVLSAVVLNFDRFSFNVWNGIGKAIGVPLETIHGSLSFSLLFLGVVATSLLGSETEKTIKLGLASAIELLSLSFLVIFIALPDDTASMTLNVVLAIILFGALFTYQLSEPKQKREWYVAVFEILLLLVLVSLASFYVEIDRYAFSGMFIALLCISVFRVIGTKRLAFTKVAAFALGVIVLDKLSTTFIPAILDLTKDKAS